MTEQMVGAGNSAGAPPLADTSDMAGVHQVFRDASESAAGLIGSATAPQRVELVASYYDNVLNFLHGHHEAEDLAIWPRLCERAPAEAEEVRRVASQHDGVVELLAASEAALAAWRQAPSADTAAAATRALDGLNAVLLPHLDEEERVIIPLAAQHIFAPEWGELPSHGMRTFGGDKLWLILGLIREQMTPEQLANMEANMPPPVAAMWRELGEAAFTDFVAELRR